MTMRTLFLRVQTGLTLTTAFVKDMLSMSSDVKSSSPRALTASYIFVTSSRNLSWISGRLASSQNTYSSYKMLSDIIGWDGAPNLLTGFATVSFPASTNVRN